MSCVLHTKKKQTLTEARMGLGGLEFQSHTPPCYWGCHGNTWVGVVHAQEEEDASTSPALQEGVEGSDWGRHQVQCQRCRPFISFLPAAFFQIFSHFKKYFNIMCRMDKQQGPTV